MAHLFGGRGCCVLVVCLAVPLAASAAPLLWTATLPEQRIVCLADVVDAAHADEVANAGVNFLANWPTERTNELGGVFGIAASSPNKVAICGQYRSNSSPPHGYAVATLPSSEALLAFCTEDERTACVTTVSTLLGDKWSGFRFSVSVWGWTDGPLPARDELNAVAAGAARTLVSPGPNAQLVSVGRLLVAELKTAEVARIRSALEAPRPAPASGDNAK
jgi:hypothetical protein